VDELELKWLPIQYLLEKFLVMMFLLKTCFQNDCNNEANEESNR
jgi:hypothetical protein